MRPFTLKFQKFLPEPKGGQARIFGRAVFGGLTTNSDPGVIIWCFTVFSI